ncbi:MAG: DUF4974 domain-containing protein [Odoribacter sp.]|nr:DUF4974 domain-containing protein [Odoribacter sp.]
MKNPFEFAVRLFQCVAGGLSDEERKAVADECAQDEALRELYAELQDKERVSRELRLMMSFDTERALRRVTGRRRRRLRIAAWGSVAALVAVAWGGWRLQRETVEVAAPEPMRMATVVWETASGERYGLDTASVIRLGGTTLNNADNTLVWSREEAEDRGEEDMPPEYHRIIVPYAATYSLVLADGTKIYMNSGTVLEVPARFAAAERRVRVTGEVYCEVAPAASWPFVVEAGGMEVCVRGTVFNVKAYPDEESFVTTLVEGSVAVKAAGQEAEQKLRPGEQASYNRATAAIGVSPADVEAQTAWKSGLFHFRRLPLEEIVHRIARWYDLEFVFADTTLCAEPFSGKVPMYATVDDVLRKFEYAGEARFELNGRTLVVYRK